jgi:hypothetical protein
MRVLPRADSVAGGGGGSRLGGRGGGAAGGMNRPGTASLGETISAADTLPM